MKPQLLLFFAFFCNLAIAQKSALTVDDLAQWNSIKQEKITPNGEWISYTLQPNHGNPSLVLYNVATTQNITFERANQPHFTADNRLLVFRIHPAMDTVRALKLADTKKDDLPPDTLGVYDLTKGTLDKVAGLKNFKVPEKWSGWIAYGIQSPLPDSITKGVDKKAYQLVIGATDGSAFYIQEAVRDYVLAEEQVGILMASDGLDSLDTAAPGIFYFNGNSAGIQQVSDHRANYDKLVLSSNSQHAAWLMDTDTTEVKIRPYELQYWNTKTASAQQIVAPTADWMPEDWRLSEHGRLHFSYDESKLYFGIAPNPILPDTNTLDEERAQVEVWTTQDPLLYTVEENNLAEEKKRNYRVAYQLDNQKITPLSHPDRREIRLANRGDAQYVLTYDEMPYLLETMWEGPLSAKDLYLTDLESGETHQIASAIKGRPRWSPNGQYVYWFSMPDTAWVAIPAAGGEAKVLTNNTISAFADEKNDMPAYPWPYGTAGWSEGDEHFYVYDRYDIWQLDPTGASAPSLMTNGRAQKNTYRYIRVDKEERHLPNDNWMLHVHNQESCAEGHAQLGVSSRAIQVLHQDDLKFSRGVTKATEAEQWLYTTESFERFPDLILAGLENKKASSKTISDANPQQENYEWGTIEHYYWTSADGQKLRGMLVKPSDFDPSKQYPMIVNFYEKSSHNLHQHRKPTAGRSTINYHHYVSQGYIIFNPDVPYRIGYPGESAYNSVISGVTSLIDKGFVDKERIGVQGHSWGGYQIAYLLTKTDIFRCAESGAPVVNMFSAYGGIRWGSGYSRQFQYEHTQSRIGGTPWEYPGRYWENSPLFFMDKVNTPVLILHNDNDGAVPWYQGIEYFNALRRLRQPAWLLNYNDEPHWPLKRPNRVDFQFRMNQFFDYYLKDAPLPNWMESGVPPILKGIDQRY